MMIGSERHAAQLTAIQPDQLAMFAAVDENVTGTIVGVSIHGLAALRASNRTFVRGGRLTYVRRSAPARPEILDQRVQDGHIYEHAPARFAIVQRVLKNRGACQLGAAQRTIQF